MARPAPRRRGVPHGGTRSVVGWGSVQLDRREVLKKALAAGIALPSLVSLLAACGDELYTSGDFVIAAPERPVTWPIATDNEPIESGLAPAGGGTLRLYNYADYLSPRVLKNFEKEFDTDISVSTFNDTDEALVKIASGDVAYDLYFPSYDQIGKLVSAGLVSPLNHDYVPNIANLWKQFQNPWYDQQWRYSVPYSVYTTGIGWRADLVEEDVAARSNPYDVFWDERYADRIAIIDDWHTAMAMVLLRAGSDDVNTGAADALDQLRSDLLALQAATSPRVNITMYNDLPAGQVALAQMWSGDAVNAVYYLPRGTPVDVLRYWFPPNGRGLVDNDLMVLLRTAANPVAAHVFINYLLAVEVAKQNFGFIGYQPPQRSINPATLVRDGFVPPNLETAAVTQEYFRVGDRLLELPPVETGRYTEIWQEFKAGG